MPKDLFFRYPSAVIWLILCFIVGVLRLAHLFYRKHKIVLFGSPKSVTPLLQADSLKLRYMAIGASCLCIACIVFAWMQPEGNIRYLHPESTLSQVASLPQPTASSHQVILLIDTSQSMAVTDVGQNQSRLDKAKILGSDILSGLKGETFSIYAFTSTLTPIMPPTLDPTVGQVLLQNIHFNEGDVGGTDFVKTLKELQEAVKTGPSYTAYTLLFFSDGGDLLWEKHHSPDRLAEILHELPQPPTFPSRFFSIGMGSLSGGTVPDTSIEGTPVLSKLEEAPLEQMAVQGGGRFYRASSTTSTRLVQQILSQIALTSDKMPLSQNTALAHTSWEATDLYYQIPLYLAMLLLFWEIRRDTWLLHIFGLLFLCSELNGEEISFVESEKALAVGSLQEFSLAESLYQSFLLRPLPNWQQEAIFYNLGTLKLQQKEMGEAVTLFHQISFTSPASPELLLRSLWNTTLATLFQAGNRDVLPEWRLYLSETALHQIDRLQDFSTLDRPLPHLKELQRELTIAWQNSIYDTKTSLLTSFSPLANIYLLQEGMERLQAKLREIEKLPSVWPFLPTETASLFSSWPTQLEKSLPKQLHQALEKRDRMQAIAIAQQISAQLVPLLSSIDPKEQWFFNYRLALLAPVLNEAHIRALFQQLQDWKPSEELLLPFLDGLQQLEKQQFSVALFLFVVAYGKLKEAYLPVSPHTPLQVLANALAWQGQAWRLAHLFSQLPLETATKAQFVAVQEAEKKALSMASTFPKALIEWQKEQKTALCDSSFWQTLLTFFDEGIASAKMALESMHTFPPSFPDLLLQQQKSTEAWQKALDWLQQIPPNGASSPQSASVEQKQALETLREMELEDRPTSSKKTAPLGPAKW